MDGDQDVVSGEGFPTAPGKDCNELSLWKVSEHLNRDQAHKLGVKLGMSSTKLENLDDKVQRRICSQEEVNFEMLLKWNANQTPDDNTEAQLCQMLKDLEFPEEIVQEMFTKENHLHQSTQERVLNQLQLYKIAEKVDNSQCIPIVLRLGLKFNDWKLTKQRCCNSADYYSLFKLLLEWQRDLPPRTDQTEIISCVLAASEQKRLACIIRNNCLNVISRGKGRSIILETQTSQTSDKFCDMDLIITCHDPAKQEQMSSKVKDMFERCNNKVELSSHGETCTYDKSTDEVKKVHDECQDVSRFLGNLKEAGTKDNMYEMNGVTIGSMILHVRVYSEEGLRILREDVDSGAIGRQLARVLMSHETGALSSNDELLDVTLAPRTIDHISQQSADLQEEFKIEMKEFVESIASSDNLVKKVNRRELTCGEPVQVMENVEAFHGDDVPSAATLLQTTAKAHHETALNEAKTQFLEGIKEVCGAEVPYMDPKELDRRLEYIKSDAEKTFKDYPKIGSRAMNEEYQRQLSNFMMETCEEYKNVNDNKTNIFIKTMDLVSYVFYPFWSEASVEADYQVALKRAKIQFTKDVEKVCGTKVPYMDPSELDRKLEDVRSDAEKTFKDYPKVGSREMSKEYLGKLSNLMPSNIRNR